MQHHFERFDGRIQFGLPFTQPATEWRFFYRDFFSMFLRWSKPIILVDGTPSKEPRLMRRKLNGAWQYRSLTASELRYILGIENGTHC